MNISRRQIRKMINEAIRKAIPAHQIKQGMGFYNMDDTVDVRSTGVGAFARGYMTDNLPTAQEVANVLINHYTESQRRGNLEQGGLIDVARAVTRVIPPADPSRPLTTTDGYEPSERDFDELVKRVSDILIGAELLLPRGFSSHHLGVIYGMVVADMKRKLSRHGYKQKFGHFQGVKEYDLYQ